MKALVFERNLPRFAAARGGRRGRARPGRGQVGPLRAARRRPARPARRRTGCGCGPACPASAAPTSPPSTAQSSRYFEPIVSFPFVPGHEVVGDLDDGSPGRARARARLRRPRHRPPCARLRRRRPRPLRAHRLRRPRARPADAASARHRRRLVDADGRPPEPARTPCPPTCPTRPRSWSSPPPAPCTPPWRRVDGGVSVVLGAGTLGLLTVAALRRFGTPGTLIATAKHPHQRPPGPRARRRRRRRPRRARPGRAPGHRRHACSATASSTGGADAVIDCVGTCRHPSPQALAVAAPGRARSSLVGMPGTATARPHRRCGTARSRLRGAYAYGLEADGRRTFDLAFELVQAADLGRLVSATYPLARYADAIAHAADGRPPRRRQDRLRPPQRNGSVNR